MQKSKIKMQKSFTFIEIIIAIGIFAIGILAVISVSAQSFKVVSLQQKKLIATNLAREGIENIRNIRDENWFYKGLSDCNKDNTITECQNGQIYENGGDCDWRCGDESNTSPRPTFILDSHLQDLDYLGNGAYNYSIDYTTKTCENDGALLKVDSNGFYQHTSGTNSIFKRLVSISRAANCDGDGSETNNNDLQVKVTVCWKDRGQWQEVSIEEHLYNSQGEKRVFMCGDPVTFTYKGSTVTYGTVVGANNRCWMDRNLGASRVATSPTDPAAYGDLFQWGRCDDGHQNRNSGTTPTRSSIDCPGHSNFIIVFNSPYDWRFSPNNNLWQQITGINNPCPAGWRIPTIDEWERERTSWNSRNLYGAYVSPLRLTAGGFRDYFSGAISGAGSYGGYWSSTVAGTGAWQLDYDSVFAGMVTEDRANGLSIRCIKN